MTLLKIIVGILLFANSLFCSLLDDLNCVVVTVPVTDLVSKPLSALYSDRPAAASYQKLTYSPEIGANSCPRTHQCVFNEVGKVCERSGEELLVEFPQFYHKDATGEKKSHFWLFAANVKSLAEIKMCCGSLAAIPDVLGAESCPNDLIIALIMPWIDSDSGLTYSVGTRFVRAPEKDTASKRAILINDFKRSSVKTAWIENELTIIPSQCTNPMQAFVEILRKWATVSNKIAYVWGGCSYCGEQSPEEFSLVQGDQSDVFSWDRPGSTAPRTGFDCSGLILRAAQCAGLPYFCKNTTTLGALLSDISQDDEIQVGDLILITRHVMVIVDTEHHRLVDVIGYSSGYGRMREISFSDAFDGISSCQDLLAAFRQKKPLTLKNAQGSAYKTDDSFRVVRIPDKTKPSH
jgi:cell wall-associated NlpC family hydrolase